MAKTFMDENFLLESATAQKLYHEYAAAQPIIDYHCHLPPEQIAQNKQFKNITEIWLGGDHYKWRFMRSSGVTEDFMTGNQPDEAKFRKFCEVLPMGVGNPLFHWSHLELQRYFGTKTLVSAATADELWNHCNSLIGTPELSARGLMVRSKVRVVCTTDDPVDTLEHHKAIAADGFQVKVLPTFRPDKSFNMDRAGFQDYIRKLAEVSGVAINSFADVTRALDKRLDYFAAHGCKVSDHAIDVAFFAEAGEAELSGILARAMNNEVVSRDDVEKYKTAILLHLGREYAKRGWAMQLHIGAQRNNSARMFRNLGPDTGFDSIADDIIAAKLARFLDALDGDDQLPKTILYNLNPMHNEVLATMIGNFQDGKVVGKMQFGSGWWFLDQQDGMKRQLTALSQLGNLGAFIGMLTDSRSFLSYTRHEYFRRILCNMIGGWVENGEYPQDWAQLQKVIEGICYKNAEAYFNF
ncbi:MULTISPECIES: glucuronate isomerase [unclassified Uliginosibacterium]|uniref:glucuronate isomerase n=1 Tax=unclassified Uliginosibacterium TaxID=2621521 RepID=UPI000C7E0FA7|nr:MULTISPECIES: glucuronate isomerase [unclassified Uliginosibacterium]MDO6385530.1 glucuronate isomerase [Uliginosibacterium sp. 31-12]PLK47571.1 glucuronate isomerase [Uliginosibacterium sp. TH139]